MAPETSWRCVQADYADPVQAAAILALLDEYAAEPAGGGTPLPAETRAALIPALQRCPSAMSFLTYAGDQAIGLINGFETLSTFAAKPVFNLHDVVVTEAWRRRGVGRFMLEQLAAQLSARGFCKLTLEVLEGNRAAQHLYRDLGFTAYSLLPEFGCAQFWEKRLSG
ncbi:MAG: GNAT family N-acetyltransferase [Spongiibacteraceae bacterium]|nr:GNAT family N-acetyltransferase [Spongiibacteraceae bacterium]